MNMTATKLSIKNEAFLINGTLTYADIPSVPAQHHGLLMNARFIQGIFDDAAEPQRFARFGHDVWDPEAQTDRLIATLPDWYEYGLRAFTTGFQGGGPCFTTDNNSIDNNPFGAEGLSLDPAYAARMDRLIRAADAQGMVVIVSFFYCAQVRHLKDGAAIRNAVKTASHFLRDGGYTNVIIEVANEMDVGPFKDHPLIFYPEGMASLIDLAREESGGLPVGCSGTGGYLSHEVAEASDLILVHGNGLTRQQYYNMIQTVRSWNLNRPIVCNEDSQAIGNMQVSIELGVSWGYYNDLTKQEPPTNWTITRGEDQFFAQRMAEGLGIEVPPIPPEEQFYLQGLEPHRSVDGKRWIRVASLYPEKINRVDFFRDGHLYYQSYDEPFTVHFKCNWLQDSVEDRGSWTASVHLCDGQTIELE
ncbi:hypothetical protein P4C99_09710 [Pontiellaceae bacterium B1224]|nr:hypothetical protein [Pontiellaceae bacterium B1224]